MGQVFEQYRTWPGKYALRLGGENITFQMSRGYPVPAEFTSTDDLGSWGPFEAVWAGETILGGGRGRLTCCSLNAKYVFDAAADAVAVTFEAFGQKPRLLGYGDREQVADEFFAFADGIYKDLLRYLPHPAIIRRFPGFYEPAFNHAEVEKRLRARGIEPFQPALLLKFLPETEGWELVRKLKEKVPVLDAGLLVKISRVKKIETEGVTPIESSPATAPALAGRRKPAIRKPARLLPAAVRPGAAAGGAARNPAPTVVREVKQKLLQPFPYFHINTAPTAVREVKQKAARRRELRAAAVVYLVALAFVNGLAFSGVWRGSGGITSGLLLNFAALPLLALAVTTMALALGQALQLFFTRRETRSAPRLALMFAGGLLLGMGALLGTSVEVEGLIGRAIRFGVGFAIGTVLSGMAGGAMAARVAAWRAAHPPVRKLPPGWKRLARHQGWWLGVPVDLSTGGKARNDIGDLILRMEKWAWGCRNSMRGDCRGDEDYYDAKDIHRAMSGARDLIVGRVADPGIHAIDSTGRPISSSSPGLGPCPGAVEWLTRALAVILVHNPFGRREAAAGNSSVPPGDPRSTGERLFAIGWSDMIDLLSLHLFRACGKRKAPVETAPWRIKGAPHLPRLELRFENAAAARDSMRTWLAAAARRLPADPDPRRQPALADAVFGVSAALKLIETIDLETEQKDNSFRWLWKMAAACRDVPAPEGWPDLQWTVRLARFLEAEICRDAGVAPWSLGKQRVPAPPPNPSPR